MFSKLNKAGLKKVNAIKIFALIRMMVYQFIVSIQFIIITKSLSSINKFYDRQNKQPLYKLQLEIILRNLPLIFTSKQPFSDSIMTSVHSQPINTISYTQNQPLIYEKFKPKYIHLHDHQKPPTNENPSKKLPFNLFLSATQYNKMLITNGKNRKKKIPQSIDGLITTLEYMNDPIFQKQISKRQKFKQIFKETQNHEPKHHRKPSANNPSYIKNSFSQDSSQQINKNHRISKLSHSDKKGHTIDYETLIPKTKKYSINYKPKDKKTKPSEQQRKSHSSFDKTRKVNKTSTNDQSLMNKSQSKKNPDISHLVIKSLIDFTQQKKAQHFNKISMERTKTAKDQYIRLLNQKIRSYNLQNSRRSGGSKSRSKSRSITKHEISLQYWDQIKDEVLNSLKNDNYSHPLKDQLKNYDFNVYDHKEIFPRKPRMSGQDMDNRRLTRGMQAKKTLQKKSQQKKSAENRVKQNLRSLEKQRKKRIIKNPKKPFKPTADLIHGAFKNIIQLSPEQKRQKDVRNVSSLFTNQGIRTEKANKRYNGKK